MIDGPRERLETVGLGAMADRELLAMVLGHGAAGRTAQQLADALLLHASGVHGLTRLTRDQLRLIPGIGTAQASRLLASVELGRRTLTTPPMQRPQFLTPELAAGYLLPRFGAYPVERFGVALLDTKHRLLRTHIVSEGTMDASLAHPREVFRIAIGGGAACILVFHNHPSGDPVPSQADHSLTHRLARAGTIVGVPVVDHVILADGAYWSFQENHLV